MGAGGDRRGMAKRDIPGYDTDCRLCTCGQQCLLAQPEMKVFISSNIEWPSFIGPSTVSQASFSQVENCVVLMGHALESNTCRSHEGPLDVDSNELWKASGVVLL